MSTKLAFYGLASLVSMATLAGPSMAAFDCKDGAITIGSARGKTVILASKSERQWRLAKFGPKRGTPMQEYGPTYKSAAEASWACFRARWLETTGYECPVV